MTYQTQSVVPIMNRPCGQYVKKRVGHESAKELANSDQQETQQYGRYVTTPSKRKEQPEAQNNKRFKIVLNRIDVGVTRANVVNTGQQQIKQNARDVTKPVKRKIPLEAQKVKRAKIVLNRVEQDQMRRQISTPSQRKTPYKSRLRNYRGD